jgi:cephalosporin hydroxylase
MSTVTISLDEPLQSYWTKRALQAFADSYVGIPMIKFPEDLRVYEHLLWTWAPNVVIEVGANAGGSALWFRDRLQTLAHYGRINGRPRVISIDLDVSLAKRTLADVDARYDETIILVESDIRDESTSATIESLLPSDARCMVVEDSGHTYETTMGALDALARFVPPGGLFVVEDGCVDVEEMRADPNWPRGVLPAIHDWLETNLGRSFVVRRDLELYGVTSHPGGFLQRSDR